MDLLAHSIAQAMADYENEHRYELENGHQSTGVEPYEASAEDFEEIAAFVADRHRGAVEAGQRLHDVMADTLRELGWSEHEAAAELAAMEAWRAATGGQS